MLTFETFFADMRGCVVKSCCCVFHEGMRVEMTTAVVGGSWEAQDASLRGRSDTYCRTSTEQRRWQFTVMLLFWPALDCNLSWKEGPERPENRVGCCRVLCASGMESLTEAKTQAAKDSVGEFIHGQLVSVKSWSHPQDTYCSLRQLRPWPELVSRCSRRNGSISANVHSKVRGVLHSCRFALVHHRMAYWVGFHFHGKIRIVAQSDSLLAQCTCS